MGEVRQPKSTGLAGTILGVIVGLVVGIGFGLVALAAESQNGSGCGNAVVIGAVLLIAAAGLGLVAWHLVFRVKSESFVVALLRAASVTLALYLLIPWPCSFTWAAVTLFSGCRH